MSDVAAALLGSEARPGHASVEEPPAKRLRIDEEEDATGEEDAAEEEEEDQNPWTVEWSRLLHDSIGHEDFRPPPQTEATMEAAPAKPGASSDPCSLVSIATSCVFVGDPVNGYNPHHVGRVCAVDAAGAVLLDVLVKPAGVLLDCRSHLTGLTRDMLSSDTALDLDVVRRKLLDLICPETILVGHRLSNDLEALGIWHGPVVDVALLFGVEGRKKNQYHQLAYLGNRVLRAKLNLDDKQDALEGARLIMRLARHEVKLPERTPPFPPREYDPRELHVRHIPRDWGHGAAGRLLQKIPGAKQGLVVNWSLNPLDPTDWRGEATMVFPDADDRDNAFLRLECCTDVIVYWNDVPDAPPLATFLSPQALIDAFAEHGEVVDARMPTKATTGEPQSFAFISFVRKVDAERVSKRKEIEVQITPTWKLPLRPKVARYGNSTDKRVAVDASAQHVTEEQLDYIHVCRRQ